MCRWMKGKATWAAERHPRRVDTLQVLPLIFRHSGIAEPAYGWVLLQCLVEKGGAAAVQAGNE
jgi:hypothetical protein